MAHLVPKLLSPGSGRVRINNEPIYFDWRYKGDYEQTGIIFMWSTDTVNWLSISSNQNEPWIEIEANTFPLGTIYWKVCTIDQTGTSPFSEQYILISAEESPAPIITSPSIVYEPRPTITWLSNEQVGCGVAIHNTPDYKEQEPLWEYYNENNTNKEIEIGIDLQPNTTYYVFVGIIDSIGVFAYAMQELTTSFFGFPEIPTFSFNIDELRGCIKFTITNPPGEIPVSHNEAYRDNQRIAADVQETFTDYTAESGKVYEYKVKAVGVNKATVSSVPVQASVNVKHTQLACTTDFSKWIELKWNPEKSESRQHIAVSNFYAGRKFAVIDFSENKNNNISNSFAIRDKAELDKLIEIYDAKQTILYRDRRGRKAFGTITGLNIADESPRTWWTVSFTLQQVDFDEVI